MDVRCEKCQTEYELDESKLKPGGVTVKCTTCGHMFKVRRRPSGHVSSAPLPPPGDGATVPRSPLADGDDGDRTWLVRLEDGEIKTCRELSTLQKWIVSGRVSRECAISRTGKKWKPLGEIGELASFFAIADEARQARASGKWGGTVTKEYPKEEEARSGGHPRTVPRRSSAGSGGDPQASGFPATPAGQSGAPVQDLLDTLQDLKPPTSALSPSGSDDKPPVNAAAAVAAGGMNPIFTRTLPLGTPLPPGMRSGSNTGRPAGASRPQVDDAPTISAPEESAALARAAEQASESFSRAAIGSPAPTSPATPVAMAAYGAPVPGPSTAGWATQGQGRVPGEASSGESGPTGGLARPSRTGEAAFVSAKQPGRLPDIRGEYENGRFVPTYYTDDDIVIPRANRVALWIILVSLVLMAGAAIAVYLFLYTGGDEEETSQAPAAATLDAGAAAATPPVAPAPPPAAGLDQAVAAAVTALTADADQGLESAAENLAGLASQPGATASAPFLVVRARVESALAQRLVDRAKLAATPAEGKPLADKAKSRAATARAAADAALAIEGAHKAAAQVALADARRLEGEKTVEVERILRQARQGPPAPPAELVHEADLVGALLLVRDDRLRDARIQLERLAKESSSGDVRARFRLAWIDFLDGNAAAARSNAEAVLAAQAEHAGAKALLDKLGAAAAPPGGATPPGGGTATPVDPKPPAGKPEPAKPAEETGAVALKRANKLAQNGNCDAAMPLYRKVLDETPSSVEALTGLGFCHLDRKEFASAHTRFRAALGISSRYQDAMWGIAELYQRQGNAEEAIEKYQAFIDAYPSTRRAAAARKQIEKLQGATPSGGGGEAPGDDPTPPDPQVDPGSGEGDGQL